jgi:hypothetical protein
MTMYTVVDDGYCVSIYKSKSALIRYIKNLGIHLSEDGEGVPTLAEIKKFVNGIDYVGYLYEEGFSGWKYRIEIQNSFDLGA